MKIGVGGIFHETNTFPKKFTAMENFNRFKYIGEDIISNFKDSKTSLGGFISSAREFGDTIIPTFYAAATPSGMISAPAFKELISLFIDNMVNYDEIDGFLLAQHGAMCVENFDDAEGYLIKLIKSKIKDKLLVVTTDYHANISPEMVRSSDCIVGYDTYPHTDIFERAVDAYHIARDALTEKFKISNILLKLPILGIPQAITTENGIIKNAMEMVHSYEKQDDILNITLAGGFCYADVKSSGISIIVSYGDQAQKARAAILDIGSYIWENRKELKVKNTDVKTAIQSVLEADKFPVILVDVADNIGGGTPGDGTVILSELIKNKVQDAVVVISDKEAVCKSLSIGVGERINLEVGGKSEDYHGRPVFISGYIKLISDGEFINTGRNMTGLKTKMGKSVLILSDGIKLVLTEHPTPPNDPGMLQSMGIDVRRERAIVVKGAIAWKTGIDFTPENIIYVDTPGLTNSNLGSFNFVNINRPVFPLDDFEVNIEDLVQVFN